jgi:hypothetical protein
LDAGVELISTLVTRSREDSSGFFAPPDDAHAVKAAMQIDAAARRTRE